MSSLAQKQIGSDSCALACWAFLSEACVDCFQQDNIDSNMTLVKISGGLVYLDEYFFAFRQYPDGSGYGAALVVSNTILSGAEC